MVVLAVTMQHRPGANAEGKEYHEVFKEQVINDINAKYRQAGEH